MTVLVFTIGVSVVSNIPLGIYPCFIIEVYNIVNNTVSLSGADHIQAEHVFHASEMYVQHEYDLHHTGATQDSILPNYLIFAVFDVVTACVTNLDTVVTYYNN